MEVMIISKHARASRVDCQLLAAPIADSQQAAPSCSVPHALQRIDAIDIEHVLGTAEEPSSNS